MPLTKKGKKIMGALQQEYGTTKGRSIFYAMRNAGRITSVERKR